MMSRIILISKIILASILLVSCSSKKTIEEGIKQYDTLFLSKEVVGRLINKESLQEYVDVNLNVSSKEILSVFIDYVEDMTFIKVSNSYKVDKVCTYNYLQYDLKTIKVYTCFNENNKLTKIFFNDLKEVSVSENDDYKEVLVSIGKSPSLNGILTLPKDVEKPKVVIMVQGSGPQDLDSSIYENKPFKDIAGFLASNKIASLRFDKRTYAFFESLDNDNLSINDEYLYDISFAIHMLEDYPVDPFNIYYLGHSLGGIIGFKVLNDHPELKGAIIMAGSSRNLIDIIYDQVVEENSQAGYNATKKTEILRVYEEAKEKIYSLTSESEVTKILDISSNYWLSLNEIYLKSSKQVNKRTLIVQGEKDRQVFIDKDYQGLKDILSDNKNVTFKTYENLNHFFMESVNDNLSDYQIKASVNEDFMKDLVKWINGEKLK